MSKILVDTIDTRSGTTNLTIGSTNSSTVTFENGAVTGHNYPAFMAKMGSNQTPSNATWTKVNFDTEIFDTDSMYDTSTYRFTPTVAGKYLINGGVDMDLGNTAFIRGYVAIYKNGSHYFGAIHDANNNYQNEITLHAQAIVDMNGSTDYVEMYARGDDNNSTPSFRGSGDPQQYFYGYRIGS